MSTRVRQRERGIVRDMRARFRASCAIEWPHGSGWRKLAKAVSQPNFKSHQAKAEAERATEQGPKRALQLSQRPNQKH